MKNLYTLISLLLVSSFSSYAQYTIQTVAGTGIAGYNGDGMRADSAQLDTPSGVWYIDRFRQLYIADTRNNRIRNINVDSIVIHTFAGTGGTVTLPLSPWWIPDSVAIVQPLCVAADDSNEVFISETPHHRVWWVLPYNSAFSITGLYAYIGNDTPGYSGDGGIYLKAQVNQPAGVCFDERRWTFYGTTTFIADKNNHVIRYTNRFSQKIFTYAGNGTAGYSGDGGSATLASLNAPFAVATDKKGNLYIADSGNHTVRKVDTFGIITTVAGTGVAGYSGDGGPADSAQLNCPQGVGVDDTGNIYISDAANHRIRKIAAVTGIITTVAGTGVAGFNGDGMRPDSAQINYPRGLFVDRQTATIYFADAYNNRVRKLVPPPTRVNNIQQLAFNIFPNPSKGIFHIENANSNASFYVSIYNIYGRQVYQSNFISSAVINVSAQPNGIYVLYLMSGQNNYCRQIVITH